VQHDQVSSLLTSGWLQVQRRYPS